MKDKTEELIYEYISDVEKIYRNKEYSAPQRGAYITALNKAYKRAFLTREINELMVDKDITTTAAMQIFKGVMGRGVSNRFLLQAFGTPDRTAANKSEIFKDDLEDDIKFLKISLDFFNNLMNGAFESVKKQSKESS
jgi:hypothetical protein